MIRALSRQLDRADWRVLASAMGVCAAAVLAWFLAPLVEVAGQAPLTTPAARLLAVAAVLWLAVATLLARRLLSARRNRAFLAQLARGAPAQFEGAERGRREVAVLGQRFEQALAQLRSLRLARPGQRTRWLGALLGRPFVHELPWYVVIGAPGAGKTTVLINSGLHFPLSDGSGNEAMRGIGGTRNCDWWFASEAVLIDTAGRYTTQDSDRDADSAAWQGFLSLLKRHRPRQPINGVLLAVSASDLLRARPEHVAAHARELRARLDELAERLAIDVPVYLLVTKTDLLPGFAEFFAHLDDNARAQVWGVTVPPGADPSQWRHDLAELDGRLHEQMLDRLGIEAHREHRAALHAFPQQWRVLNRAAGELLHAVLAAESAKSRAGRPMLRGLYFTSAAQAALPMDATTGMARVLDLPATSIAPDKDHAGSRSFFVTRLLRDVVFAESGLAGTTMRGAQSRRLVARAAVAAMAAVLLLAAGAVWRSFERQSSAIDVYAGQLPSLEAAVARARRANDLTALLPALDALAAAEADRSDDGGVADRLLERRDMLATAAADSYRRLLRQAFLPRIAARLEDKLRNAGDEPVVRTYETLRAYLMLFGGKHFDSTALREYLANDWHVSLPETVSASERAALLRHLDQLLAGGEVGAPSRADAQLIAGARTRVQRVPLAQRAATRLQQINANAPRLVLHAAGVLVRVSGAPLADAPAPRVEAGLPRERLRERTNRVLAQLAQEQIWVLGEAPAAAAAPGLAEEVERLFSIDNAVHWQTLLDDLRLAPTDDLKDSAGLARALSQADMPLLALLRAAVRETSAGSAQTWFAALRNHVDGATPAIVKTQALLGKLATLVGAVAEATQRKALPPPSDGLRELMRELAQAAQDAPGPLNGLLTQLHTTLAGQLLAAVREPLSREMAREITPACSRAVANHYPFVRDAVDEMTRDEFARTFGAGGLIDGFFQTHLASYPESARTDMAAPFQRAQSIRDAFFRDGGRALGTRLEFRLLELDAGAAEFSLDVDGQKLRFRRDTKQPQSIDWLATGTVADGVHVLLTPTTGSGYTFKGPWALLRLLDRARVERGASADRVLISFDVEGRKARFEVRSTSARNPLLRQDLEPFQCPNRL